MKSLFTFHGGIHPPEFKQQSNGAAIATPPLPPLLSIPLSQHLGNPAKPCVTVGDTVSKGQCIATADGRVSAAVHAPTSGVIRAIGDAAVAHPSGLAQPAITLEPDGRDAWGDKAALQHWQQADDDTLRTFLRDMGVVGQGGAVFPTSLKLGVSRLAQLVVNGAECEPFISCDDRLMRERASEIVQGIAIAAQLMGPDEVLIGIEDNKPEAIAAMRAACSGTPYQVIAIPTLYPSGGAKQLIRILTGKEVPHGVRSTELGVQCFNVATLYSVKRAIVDGEPVISRIVTLTGALQRTGNVEALLGTPVSYLLDWAGIAADCDGVIMGGPMMGFELPSLAAGVSKACNCLIAKTPALFPPRPPALPCIRCGACADVCPVSLQPMELYWHAKARDTGRAQEAHLFDCIECGACSYVCPSQLPLVDFYKFAKDEIWAAERDRKAADRARMRHEFRQQRHERDQAEKAARLAQRAAPAPTEGALAAPDADKAAAIRAAMEKAAARKAASAERPAPSEEDKRAAIEAAMARAAAKKAERDATSSKPAPADAAAASADQPVIDDAKRAAIEAAMARAAAKKAERDAAGSHPAPAEAAAASADQPVIDDAKRAAIEAAMARAAAKKAERERKEQN